MGPGTFGIDRPWAGTDRTRRLAETAAAVVEGFVELRWRGRPRFAPMMDRRYLVTLRVGRELGGPCGSGSCGLVGGLGFGNFCCTSRTGICNENINIVVQIKLIP